MTATDHSWVLITGASSGFGGEFARQYAKQGHSLVLVARRLDRLQALAEALRRQHRIEVVVEQVDLPDIAAVIDLHRRLQERGIAIDILINNAGQGLQGPFVDSQLDAALAMAQLDVASLTAVERGGAHLDHPLLRSRLRRTHFEHFTFNAQLVAGTNRVRPVQLALASGSRNRALDKKHDRSYY